MANSAFSFAALVVNKQAMSQHFEDIAKIAFQVKNLAQNIYFVYKFLHPEPFVFTPLRRFKIVK